jgi:hypothetical protein
MTPDLTETREAISAEEKLYGPADSNPLNGPKTRLSGSEDRKLKPGDNFRVSQQLSYPGPILI